MIRLIGHWQAEGRIEKPMIFVQGNFLFSKTSDLMCDSTCSRSSEIKIILRTTLNAKPSSNKYHIESLSYKLEHIIFKDYNTDTRSRSRGGSFQTTHVLKSQRRASFRHSHRLRIQKPSFSPKTWGQCKLSFPPYRPFYHWYDIRVYLWWRRRRDCVFRQTFPWNTTTGKSTTSPSTWSEVSSASCDSTNFPTETPSTTIPETRRKCKQSDCKFGGAA